MNFNSKKGKACVVEVDGLYKPPCSIMERGSIFRNGAQNRGLSIFVFDYYRIRDSPNTCFEEIQDFLEYFLLFLFLEFQLM